jgi:hypothetical protein
MRRIDHRYRSLAEPANKGKRREEPSEANKVGKGSTDSGQLSPLATLSPTNKWFQPLEQSLFDYQHPESAMYSKYLEVQSRKDPGNSEAIEIEVDGK